MFKLASLRSPLAAVVRNSSRMLSSQTLTVHGHYVSQPARAVLWLLKINEQPFDFINVAAMGGETKTPEYKAKFPIGQIPALEDGDFRLSEGSAIMQYLCEKYKWNQWWPQGSDELSQQKRAKLSEYMSYHHHGTRMISHKIAFKLFYKQFFKKDYPETDEELKMLTLKIIDNFERKGLCGSSFIGGSNSPTIADLFAYSEIYQMVYLGVVAHSDLSPAMQTWSEAMQALPAHDDVHTSLKKMANAIEKSKSKE